MANKRITIHNYQQGSQEWLDARLGLVTCSNALLLLEKGKQACMLANKDAATRITPNGNFYAERGHVLEEEVRNALNEDLKKQGLELREAGILTNSEYQDAGYSPDGLVCRIGEPTEDYLAIVEIKSYNDVVERKGDPASGIKTLRKGDKILGTSYNEFGEPVTRVYVGKHANACKDYDNVPLVARAQIQMELLISEAPMCYLILYNPDATGTTPTAKTYTVLPDEKLQENLRKKLLQK